MFIEMIKRWKIMIKIAIVEDDDLAAKTLESFLKKYGNENTETFYIEKFQNAIALLENYTAQYDIVFMDIDLPLLNGMDAAKKLRRIDKSVTIIFVTNMAQFAIKGYEVDALDFMVKPIKYPDFSFRLKKAVFNVKDKEEKYISLHDAENGGYIKTAISRIKYVEIMSHKVTYHLEEGNLETYGTLKNVENLLLKSHFARCNSCYLVNLKYVRTVRGFVVDVDGEELKISQAKKQGFMKALNEYIGGGFDV